MSTSKRLCLLEYLMKDAIISDLVKIIRAKQCILFVGSGLSNTIGLPLWNELIDEMKPVLLSLAETKKDRDEEKKYLNTASYLDIATRFKFKVGLGSYSIFLKEKYRMAITQLSPSHNALTRIKLWPFAITTNFDKLLETAFTIPGNVAPTIVTQPDELIMSLRSGDFFILKLHGDIDRPQSIVLTRDEYENFVYDRRGHLLLDTLKQQLIFKSVLFIGFSLSDPNFQRIFGESGWLANGYQGEAFSIMAKTTKPEREEWQRRRLRILPLDDFDELTPMLNIIADQVIGLGNDIVIVNRLGYDFGSPKEFLNSHPILQVSARKQYEIVAKRLFSSHAGFGVPYLDSDEFNESYNASFKELGLTNHLLITLTGKDIDFVPKTFWERMPCDYKTLCQLVRKDKKKVFGIKENDGLYILLVAAFSEEDMKKAILDFLDLTAIPSGGEEFLNSTKA